MNAVHFQVTSSPKRGEVTARLSREGGVRVRQEERGSPRSFGLTPEKEPAQSTLGEEHLEQREQPVQKALWREPSCTNEGQNGAGGTRAQKATEVWVHKQGGVPQGQGGPCYLLRVTAGRLWGDAMSPRSRLWAEGGTVEMSGPQWALRAGGSPPGLTYLAAASWELVVISMASWTLRCRASRVLWSTGSTDCTSTLLTTSPFWGKMAWSRGWGRTLLSGPLVSRVSKPKTAVRMMRAEFLWKSSKVTEATAPRTRDAMALQASPTKSGTEKSLAVSLGSFRSLTSKCL